MIIENTFTNNQILLLIYANNINVILSRLYTHTYDSSYYAKERKVELHSPTNAPDGWIVLVKTRLAQAVCALSFASANISKSLRMCFKKIKQFTLLHRQKLV